MADNEEDNNPVLDARYLQALGGPSKRRDSGGSEHSTSSNFSNATHYSEISGVGLAPLSLSVSKSVQQQQARGRRSSVSTMLRSVTLHSEPRPQTLEEKDYDEDGLEALREQFSKKPRGCKGTWCAQKIFREVPIIGGLFDLHTSTRESLSAMAREACGLAAGLTAMVVMPLEAEESEQKKIAKLALAMTAGTVAGKITYNMAGSACNGMTMLYRCCLKRLAKSDKNQQVLEDGALRAAFHHKA